MAKPRGRPKGSINKKTVIDCRLLIGEYLEHQAVKGLVPLTQSEAAASLSKKLNEEWSPQKVAARMKTIRLHKFSAETPLVFCRVTGRKATKKRPAIAGGMVLVNRDDPDRKIIFERHIAVNKRAIATLMSSSQLEEVEGKSIFDRTLTPAQRKAKIDRVLDRV